MARNAGSQKRDWKSSLVENMLRSSCDLLWTVAKKQLIIDDTRLAVSAILRFAQFPFENATLRQVTLAVFCKYFIAICM